MADIYLLPVHPPIDMEATLMGGQAFRWKKDSDGWFSGVVQGCFLRLRAAKAEIEFVSSLPEDQSRLLLTRYFRLDDDIQTIHGELSRDPAIAQLIQKYAGLRLLRQDPWECLVCLPVVPLQIASTGSNRLVEKLAMDRLADAFGSPIDLGRGRVRRDLPQLRRGFVSAGLPRWS